MKGADGKLDVSESLEVIDDGFELVRIIGKGTVGTVCEYRRRSDDRVVAIKLMKLTPMGTPEVFEGIIKAALATKPLADQTNVVRVFSAGKVPPNTYYIIMEMMRGGTLEEYIKRVELSLKEKLDISAKIADALYAIHFKGIIHGDLKPSNILMSAEGEPYLNDFYLYSSDSSTQIPYMSIGTPFYMSPEQASGALVTPKTDIYSFGVMLYELVTGEMPYSTGMDSINGLIEEITNGSIAPPSKRKRGVSPKLDAVILKLLEKEPDERYRDMALAASDLRGCRENGPISIPAEKQSFWHRFFHRR
ncbi:MAG: serine/threonine protein kinase [Kiritimatiellaeota bacterium]|nr:serine/threonine protein kinase [Kiritimatiellota bacterium]